MAGKRASGKATKASKHDACKSVHLGQLEDGDEEKVVEAHPLISKTLVHRLRDQRDRPRQDLAHERLRRDGRSAVIAVRADSVLRDDHEDDVGGQAEENEGEDGNDPWDGWLRRPREPAGRGNEGIGQPSHGAPAERDKGE